MTLSDQEGAFHLSTRDMSAAERLPALRKVFEELVHLNFEVQPDQPIDAEMTVHAMPRFRRTRMVSSLSVAVTRPASMLADGDDSVCLILNTGGRLAISQRGQEAVANVGDGLLLLYQEPAFLQFSEMSYLAVRVPFAELAALARNLDALRGLRIPRDTEALCLLRAYLASLPARIEDAQLSRHAATHVYDLIALAIGATCEGRQLASQRSLRVARLESIKADLRRDTTVKLDQLAARQGISPRYVQMLFEDVGTSFSAFVLDHRLETVRGMLASPRYASWLITAIALEAGFGDLSYFNRQFKKRYGLTPSDLRMQINSDWNSLSGMIQQRKHQGMKT